MRVPVRLKAIDLGWRLHAGISGQLLLHPRLFREPKVLHFLPDMRKVAVAASNAILAAIALFVLRSEPEVTLRAARGMPDAADGRVGTRLWILWNQMQLLLKHLCPRLRKRVRLDEMTNLILQGGGVHYDWPGAGAAVRSLWRSRLLQL